jgi:hypothetical protein
MKICLCCGAECAPVAPHCPACGEASFDVFVDPAVSVGLPSELTVTRSIHALVGAASTSITVNAMLLTAWLNVIPNVAALGPPECWS